VKALGIKQVLSTLRSPWQRAYVERLIRSIRRECHLIVVNERSLHRTLALFPITITGTHLSVARAKMHRKADGHKAPMKVSSSKFGKSADCIITMNADLADTR
jgi:transposase InsO family protein